MSVSRRTRTAILARTLTWSALLLAAVSCTPGLPSTSGQADDSTSDSTSDATSPASTTAEVDPTSGGASTSGSTTEVFDPWPDDPEPPSEPTYCDQWSRCAEGKKCVPFIFDGGLVTSGRCAALVRDPAGLDEPCSRTEIGVAVDTCDVGLLCWGTDPDTKLGRCRPLCTGSAVEPVCPPAASCLDIDDGIFALCFEHCDPLDPACPGADLCVAAPSNFVCAPDASGDEGQAFDPCEYANACDGGLVCAAVESAAECDPAGYTCCLPLCDLTQPPDCPGQDQECVAWYPAGTAPDGLADVGVCSRPLP